MKTSQLFAKMFAESGFKIRQVCWIKNSYWYFDDKDNFIRNEDGNIIAAYLEQIFQKEWEPHIEPPSKKVKKTFYRAWLESPDGTIYNTAFYPDKASYFNALQTLNFSKMVEVEERGFEV